MLTADTGLDGWASTAVPVDVVDFTTQALAEQGVVTRAALPVAVRRLDEGLVVDEPSIPHPQLRPGDTILAVDGVPTPSLHVLLDVLGASRPGDQVTLTVTRDNRTEPIVLSLVTDPIVTHRTAAPPTPPTGTGLTLVPAAERWRRRTGLDGLVVRGVHPAGPFFDVLVHGDILIAIAGNPVTDSPTALRTLERAEVATWLRVWRDGALRGVRYRPAGSETTQ